MKEDKDLEKSEGYNLYTEKIVKDPFKKFKKIFQHIAKIVGSAILFAVVAGLVFVLICFGAKNILVEDETTTHDKVVIPTDSQSYEDGDYLYEETTDYESETESVSEDTLGVLDETQSTDAVETEADSVASYENMDSIINEKIKEAFAGYKPGINEIESIYSNMRTAAVEANKAMVTVVVSDTDENWIDVIYSEKSNTFGIIVAQDNDNYYVLTQLDEVKDKEYIMVSFNSGLAVSAKYVSCDVTTGIAVVSVVKDELDEKTLASVKVMEIGNSYLVQNASPVILLGHFFGDKDMVVYGMTTSVKKTYLDTDSNYKMIYTDVVAGEADAGMVVNTDGELIGLVTYNSAKANTNIVSAYGISELKPLIERLINGKVTPYVGVRPQTITHAMQTAFDMPGGVYICEIEPDSPAYEAGIQSGDIIVAVDEMGISSTRDFSLAIYSKEIDDSVTFYVLRPGMDEYREVEIIVSLGVEK